MDNIDNVIKRREMTRRNMAIKPEMMSAARNITRSVRRREQAKSKLDSDKNKYHISA
jgi:hypothetical protein